MPKTLNGELAGSSAFDKQMTTDRLPSCSTDIKTQVPPTYKDQGTDPWVPHYEILTLKGLMNLPRNTKSNSKIFMDVTRTKYSVIRMVAEEELEWNLIDKETANVSSSSENEGDDREVDIKRINGECHVMWCDTYISENMLKRLLPFQNINHFPGSYLLGMKNNLAKNLCSLRREFPEDYDFFPRTWLLPFQYEELKKYTAEAASRHNRDKNQKRPWFIVKPEASCQGRGIFMTKNIESDVTDHDHYVVQEYIRNPYLIEDLKFDFRIYVLIRSVHPLKVFMFREGLSRFSTEPYQKPNSKNKENKCIHLTNYAVNKLNPNFIFNESEEHDDIGHKRSFSSVLKLLEAKGENVSKVIMDIRHVIMKTIATVQPMLSHIYRACQPNTEYNGLCFEILGFDIMLDAKLKPWLLEVNHTPSFSTDTPLDFQIKQHVILDTLNLLNISNKGKKAYYEGKKKKTSGTYIPKLTPEERVENERNQRIWEDKHMGGYLRIYPTTEDRLDYAPFLQCAKKTWDCHSNSPIKKKRTVDYSNYNQQDSNNTSMDPTKPNRVLNQVGKISRSTRGLLNHSSLSLVVDPSVAGGQSGEKKVIHLPFSTDGRNSKKHRNLLTEMASLDSLDNIQNPQQTGKKSSMIFEGQINHETAEEDEGEDEEDCSPPIQKPKTKTISKDLNQPTASNLTPVGRDSPVHKRQSSAKLTMITNGSLSQHLSRGQREEEKVPKEGGSSHHRRRLGKDREKSRDHNKDDTTPSKRRNMTVLMGKEYTPPFAAAPASVSVEKKGLKGQHQFASRGQNYTATFEKVLSMLRLSQNQALAIQHADQQQQRQVGQGNLDHDTNAVVVSGISYSQLHQPQATPKCTPTTMKASEKLATTLNYNTKYYFRPSHAHNMGLLSRSIAPIRGSGPTTRESQGGSDHSDLVIIARNNSHGPAPLTLHHQVPPIQAPPVNPQVLLPGSQFDQLPTKKSLNHNEYSPEKRVLQRDNTTLSGAGKSTLDVHDLRLSLQRNPTNYALHKGKYFWESNGMFNDYSNKVSYSTLVHQYASGKETNVGGGSTVGHPSPLDNAKGGPGNNQGSPGKPEK